jgi:hypothetical protein
MAVADNATFVGCFVILAVTGGLSLIFFGVAGYLLRIEEITNVLKKIARKVKKE